MAQVQDQTVTTETGTADGDTFTVTVDTTNADYVVAYVDDGTGSAPAQYDVSTQVSYTADEDNYMPHGSQSGLTSTRNVYSDVTPYTMEFTFTNSSSGTAQYRVRVVAIEGN